MSIIDLNIHPYLNGVYVPIKKLNTIEDIINVFNTKRKNHKINFENLYDKCFYVDLINGHFYKILNGRKELLDESEMTQYGQCFEVINLYWFREKYKSMLNRTIGLKDGFELDSRKRTYINCKLCDEWLDYDNFLKWTIDNYWTYKDEVMCIDKDLLIPNNKLYSPDTCVFLPNSFNVAIALNKSSKYGLCGVYNNGGRNKCWVGRAQRRDKIIRKSFYTPLDAQKWYIQEKNNYIHQLAEDDKNLIPQNVYEAMIKYDANELIEIPQWVYEYEKGADIDI